MNCTEMVAIEGCASDGASFVSVKIVTEFGRDAAGNVVPHKTHYVLADDTHFVLPAGWTVSVGACRSSAAAQRVRSQGVNIASGTLAPQFDPAGNGASWVYPGGVLQSVTVAAVRAGAPGSANSVQVDISGTTIYLVAGQTYTWSVAQDPDRREFLDADIRVTCNGNSAANIGWTEEV